jgi:hypothetical protein
MFEGFIETVRPLSDSAIAERIVKLEGILRLTDTLNGSTEKRGASPTYSKRHIDGLSRSLRKLKKIQTDRKAKSEGQKQAVVAES